MFPGFWQVMLVLLIVLILFGAGKLPRVMGDLAQGVKSFKKGLSEDEEEKAEQPLQGTTSERGPTPPAIEKDEVLRS